MTTAWCGGVEGDGRRWALDCVERDGCEVIGLGLDNVSEFAWEAVRVQPKVGEVVVCDRGK